MPSVVLIEDNSADVILIRRALEVHHVECDVDVLEDGEQAAQFLDALELSDTLCPDLLILDLNLPKVSGHEVLQRFRNNSRCSDAQVMILSSSAARDDKDAVARLGADAYITKPTRLNDFLQIGATIKEFLNPRRDM